MLATKIPDLSSKTATSKIYLLTKAAIFPLLTPLTLWNQLRLQIWQKCSRMIVVLLYISADSRLWRREAQTEQITVFCDFSLETSEIVIKCGFICERYIHIITLVTWSDVSDHVEWLRQEHRITRDEVEFDPVVLGAATRRDLTHQIKLLK